MLPEVLLAKSCNAGGKPITLERHLLDAERAAINIFRLDCRWGENWCRFFGIEDHQQKERFLLNLRVAALFHDIGKANEDFYRAVSVPGKLTQTLRHEHLSALILSLNEVREWLSANRLLDVDVVTASVLSHHIKAAEGGELWKWCQPQTSKSTLALYLNHVEVASILKHVSTIAGLSEPPRLPLEVWSNGIPWAEAWQKGIKAGRVFSRDIRTRKERLGLLLATKAGLIATDAVASGIVRENHSIDEWIKATVHTPWIEAKDIAAAVIKPRIRQLEKHGEKPFHFHPFQTEVAQKGSRVLLLAACAAGKTLAAWKWAEAQAERNRIGRVIFLYPTRGTATEGFRDYVGWAPEGEGALVHGTSGYELEEMTLNPSEATMGKSHALSEAEQRLFALALWSRRYFSATVDQFLGFMEHSYTGLCLLPLLADAAVIIDEIHSFDRSMFDRLVTFLKTFNVPVLCMTATLPPSRRDELIEAGLIPYPTEKDLKNLSSLEEKERHPRYRLEPVADEKAALLQAVDGFSHGQRVLWVVNTVHRCQEVAGHLETQLRQKVLTYHSRFRLMDRQRVHKQTVSAFQQSEVPCIAVTTQVCEMSLDLDADVLVTEIAPISSLVQRFGRANRHLAKGMDFRAKLHTYIPPNCRPYVRKEVEAAISFLKELGTGDMCQRRMAELLESLSPDEPVADISGSFLWGGYYATPGDFREIEDFTHPCILDSDLDTVRKLKDRHKSYDGYVVNVPKKFSSSGPEWLPKFLGAAESKFYSEDKGFIGEMHATE